jgi:hypothetical protein
MASINKAIIEQVIERVSGKLRQNQSIIDEAYTKIDGDLSVSMPIKFKPSSRSGAIDVEVGIKFKLDEVNEKDKYTLFDGPPRHEQKTFDFDDDYMRRWYEILLRDFRPFADTISIIQDARTCWPQSPRYRKFNMAA